MINLSCEKWIHILFWRSRRRIPFSNVFQDVVHGCKYTFLSVLLSPEKLVQVIGEHWLLYSAHWFNFLQLFHIACILLVHAPVSGLTKFLELSISWWRYRSSTSMFEMTQYNFHFSVMIVDPGSAYVLTSGSRVEAEWSGTSSRKTQPLVGEYPSETYFSFMSRLCLYFCWATKLSSSSSVTSSPLIWIWFLTSQFEQTWSRKMKTNCVKWWHLGWKSVMVTVL
jgi:hypothetical protein